MKALQGFKSHLVVCTRRRCCLRLSFLTCVVQKFKKSKNQERKNEKIKMKVRLGFGEGRYPPPSSPRNWGLGLPSLPGVRFFFVFVFSFFCFSVLSLFWGLSLQAAPSV